MYIWRNGKYLEITDDQWKEDQQAYTLKGWVVGDAPAPPDPPAAPAPTPSPIVIGDQNPVILTPSEAPENPTLGQIYEDVSGVIHAWNGTRWVP